MRLILFIIGMLSLSALNAQVLTVDPTTTAAVGTSAALENNSFRDIKSKQDLINTATTTTAATVEFLNQWHDRLYRGLKTVSGNVTNGYQVYRSGEKILKILELQREILELGRENPMALAWAVEIEKNMVKKAVEMYAQIQTVILKMNDDKVLMDAGERIQLMNIVLRDLQIMEGMLYYARRKVKWVISQGLINAINPFAQYVNRDAALVREILGKFRF